MENFILWKVMLYMVHMYNNQEQGELPSLEGNVVRGAQENLVENCILWKVMLYIVHVYENHEDLVENCLLLKVMLYIVLRYNNQEHIELPPLQGNVIHGAHV